MDETSKNETLLLIGSFIAVSWSQKYLFLPFRLCMTMSK
jgi:hypothetical protein